MRGWEVRYPNADLCRVALHAGAGHVDLALPAEVPVAALIPSVLDVLDALASSDGGPITRGAVRPDTPYRLSRPGAAALDGSKTLAQQAIRDGTVLLLTRAAGELPSPRFDDPAEQVSATVRGRARPWTPRATRFAAILAAGWLGGVGVALLTRSGCAAAGGAAALGSGSALIAAMLARRVHRDTVAALTLSLLAVGFAAAAGLVAVPGGPGAPNALLAATASAAVAVLTMQLAGCGGPIMTAVCCLAVLTAVAALAAVPGRLSPQVIAAATAAGSIGLLQAAARASIVGTGLSRRLEQSPWPAAGRDDGAVRAHDLLTGLVAAFSAAAALGAAGAAAAAHTGGAAFAALCGAALLLRTRSHTDRFQIAALVTAAMAAFGAALTAAVTAVAAVPQHLLLCVVAALAGVAMYLSFTAPAWSPVTRRGVELLEYLTLAALVPVACWACGCYGAARGLSLA